MSNYKRLEKFFATEIKDGIRMFDTFMQRFEEDGNILPFNCVFSDPHMSLYLMVTNAFTWKDTNEGADYWSDIASKAIRADEMNAEAVRIESTYMDDGGK